MFDEELAQLGALIFAIGAVGAEVQCLPMRWLAARRLGSNVILTSQRNEAFHHVVRMAPIDGALNRVKQRGPAVGVYLEKQRPTIMVPISNARVLYAQRQTPDASDRSP